MLIVQTVRCKIVGTDLVVHHIDPRFTRVHIMSHWNSYTIKMDSHIPCRSFPFDLHSVAQFDSHIPWHGMCESALHVNQIWPHCVNQTQSKPLAEQHGMCESAFRLPYMYLSSLTHHMHHCPWQLSLQKLGILCRVITFRIMIIITYTECEIRGALAGEYEGWCFLGCDTKRFGRWVPTSCSDLLTPSPPWW
jgi:hypothetical protein